MYMYKTLSNLTIIPLSILPSFTFSSTSPSPFPLHHIFPFLSPSLSPSSLSLPSPPQGKGRPRGLPSVERAPPNSLPSAIAAAQLSEIPESPDTTASSSLLSESQFQARLEELKTQVQKRHQNGGNGVMTNGASAGD